MARQTVVIDARADSTLDAQQSGPQTPDDVIEQIGREEIAESEAIAERIAADEQASIDAAHEALAAGYREAMRHAAKMVTAMFAELKPVWADESMNNIGDALAHCDEHYGWGGAGKLLGHPLVHLAVASFPVAVGTAQYFKMRRAQAEAEALRMRAAAEGAASAGRAMPAGTGAKPTGPAPDLSGAIDAAVAA